MQENKWIYGIHAVKAALEKENISKIYITPILKEKLGWLSPFTHKITVKSSQEIDQLFAPKTAHQNIAAFVEKKNQKTWHEWHTFFSSVEQSVLIILDQVTDPQNIGAVLRSAAAFKADGVIVPEKNSSTAIGTIAKIAAGGASHTPFIKVPNLVRAIADLKKSGYWCVGFDERAPKTLQKHKFDAKTVLIFGSEDKGLRQLTLKKCDYFLALPTTGGIKSLNVSNAAAIGLYAYRISYF